MEKKQIIFQNYQSVNKKERIEWEIKFIPTQSLSQFNYIKTMKKRKASTIQKFLTNRGLKKTPRGKVIDHKTPLKDGGTDSLRNLHLIKIKFHKEKTAKEARRRAKKKK